MPRMGKAVVCRELNQPVSVEEISVDAPGRGEVMLEVAACGVCHSDLSAVTGTIPMAPPLVLGHEAAGKVIEVGEGVTEFEVGDHAVANFVYMCGTCRYCSGGRPTLCIEQGKALVTLPDGTVRTRDVSGAPLNVFSGCGVMARYATLAAQNLVKIDRNVPLDRAALVGCAVTTGVGAVFNTARVRAGSAVAVFGCGGVGLNVIQGAAIAGANRIVAIDSLEPKLLTARTFGATDVIQLLAGEDPTRALKKLTGGGPDYAFECVGNGQLAGLAYKAICRGGLAVVVGIAKREDTTSILSMSLPFEEKTLTGSYFGSCVPRVDYPRMLSLYAGGKLKLDELITRRYRVDEAPQAFDDLRSGRNARGMIVFQDTP